MEYDFQDEREKGNSDLRSAQLVMLRILKIFDSICRKYDLKYWLDAGTLLGAARHKGFIPWDDDVDVAMPIEDYSKFLEVAEKELPFDLFLQTKETDPEHDITWAKIRDRFSYMDDPGGPYNYCQGIPIDIFPMYEQTKNQFKYRNIVSLFEPFNNEPLKTSERYSFKHNLYNSVYGFIQKIILLIFRISPFKKSFERHMFSKNKKNIKGFAYNPERPWFQFFPEETVFPLKKIQFEGYDFSCPCDTDRYLTIYYGDWMTPPPEGKRDVHSINGIHLYDAGPSPSKQSLNWNDYHGDRK